jgi:hypothetical protein
MTMTIIEELMNLLETAIKPIPSNFGPATREALIEKFTEEAKKAIAKAKKEAAKVPPPPTIDLATVFIGGMHSSEILEMQRWWNNGNPIPFDMYTRTAFKAGWEAAMREVIKIAAPSPSVEE